MLLRARPYIIKGDEARDRRDWPAAEAAYEIALRREPKRPGVWMQYGHVMLETGRPDKALEAYTRADQLRPGTVDSNLCIGHALKNLGRLEDAHAAYSRTLEIEPDYYPALRERARVSPRPADFTPDRLNYVMLGTTGLCNASCLHCPTGKDSTAHVPRIPMAMPLFRKIIDELADMGLPIMGQIAFGLFGDGLVDPFVVERVRYAREKLPHVPISVNSNAAAYDPKKHAVLADIPGVIIGLHSESIVPETFNHLMAPLRHERVIVKYEMIMAQFPGRVHASIPVSRANLDEVQQTKKWFEDRGAANVIIVPLMSRCATDLRLFNQISISPEINRCGPSALEDLAIDCDGLMLACCQDFRRTEPIGNLKTQSLREVIYGEVRRDRMRAFEEGQHDTFDSCSKCYGDRIDAIEREMALV
ncbi:tetratricopeptide repeat protein [Sphingomonas naphthae]|uniref:Tetratricopeptide repeat protein n=1 Tax=Sphingomonas naphthae TaxID=1813468 RepID=A0ABY7TM59_9SPHN|nr:tetratricopeptide repeat protein [Sphingomonas naphthae]WCT74327.1 tetratricopeptide repeat protein [Sphingomonas naphthae]